MYARVADAAHRHQAGEAGLWRNPDLKLARDWFKRERPNGAWAERYGGGFDLADTFLRQSTRRSFLVRGTLAAVLIVSYGATLVSMQETARQKKTNGRRSQHFVSLHLSVAQVRGKDSKGEGCGHGFL